MPIFKQIIKKVLSKKILNLRHLFFAWLGAQKYRNPSRKLVVVGITGTSGKSTIVFLLRQLLENAGFKVGSLSTIDFYIAGEDKLNDTKMTMLGRTAIQKYLREMVDKKCDIAIVETTSEGVVQYRHKFINYDLAILTNLYPEHIESHGSFEKYKQAKLKFFAHVAKSKTKIINGKKINKAAFVNGNLKEAAEFLNYNFSSKIIFGRKDNKVFYEEVEEKFLAENTRITKNGLFFNIDNHSLEAPLYGEHNISNITAAIGIARYLSVDWEKIKDGVKKFKSIPGRIEFIKEAEKFGFQIIVDYAFEPVALKSLYKVVELIKPKRIIHVCGATGGGRDKSRRIPIGQIIGKNADICIITNEDPYDDDPMEIINQVGSGAESAGKREGKNLFKILDRQDAINKALSLVNEKDIILITGKGSEQAICVKNGKKIPWDDRVAAKKALSKIWGQK